MSPEPSVHALPSSFRDPSGFLFRREGQLYRQVNESYREHFELLMQSGLYDELVRRGLLIPHEEVESSLAPSGSAWKVLRPELVPTISYPYEWPFSLLQDAALATLDLQLAALEHGMVLKDATAYNIQLHKGRPTLIDSLSFERYEEGQPWIAYGQFCRHFLAPLALMAHRDVRFGLDMRVHIDGLPLDFASKNLPGWTRYFSFGLMSHLHLHARLGLRHGGDGAGGAGAKPQRELSLNGMKGLIGSLRSTVAKLRWRPAGTEWGDYYDFTNYTDDSMHNKRAIVEDFLDRLQPKELWDLGANTGAFSRLASDRGISTVAMDIDAAAVEKNYRQVRDRGEDTLLPLLIDLRNPSPSLGWANRERDALFARGPVDTVMALALIHHISISNNVPLAQSAQAFAELGRWLIIEFVPKRDSQVKKLLSTREDIFPDYHEEGFERAYESCFEIEQKRPVEGSERTLYLMRRKND